MRRVLPIGLGAALLAALALAGPGTAAPPKKVALGDYEATLSLTGGDYRQGRFTVVKAKRKRKIVPTEEVGAIYYPDADECEKLTAPLLSERIPINRRGRFEVRERTQADAGDLVVVWKGRWREPRVVTGKIVIRYGRCVSRLRWRGVRVR